MIHISREKDCCGCGACRAVCPTDAIAMQHATLGALIPTVDTDRCVQCGACDRVCPMSNRVDGSDALRSDAYAAYAKDDSVRYSGSSGGMFGTFATHLIQEGYLVYGAAFDEHLQLKCTGAETVEQLAPLTKSKYLQSDASAQYAEIKRALDSGRSVLFVSTPCQVTALKCYLGKEYDTLITVDFFCHGVPSQHFFDQCVGWFEEQRGVRVTDFSFRSKMRRGATPHYYTITYRDGTATKQETKLYFDFPFYAAFQRYVTLRESCYDCRFATPRRHADITIGDFHEIDRYVKGINRFDGVSTVIVHTEKGRRLWSACEEGLTVHAMDIRRMTEDGVCFSGGTVRPTSRDAFAADYAQLPFDAFLKKHLDVARYRKQRLYYALPRWLRTILKKLMRI